jgi:hypothetical protein
MSNLNYLTRKINKYMIDIVRSYLLPSRFTIIKNFYTSCHHQLLNNTWWINDRLTSNHCSDNNGRWYYDLNCNTKIIKLNDSQWTIRKII